MSDEEINVIAAYLGTDANSFVDDYCQMSGGQPVLAQGQNIYCIFWDGLCTIHPVKPRMCKAWPFIESVLVDASNWRIMAASCPGIHANVPDGVVKACVERALSDLQVATSD